MLLNPWPTPRKRSNLVRPRRSKARRVPGPYQFLIVTEENEESHREARWNDLAPSPRGPVGAWCSSFPTSGSPLLPEASKRKQKPEVSLHLEEWSPCPLIRRRWGGFRDRTVR